MPSCLSVSPLLGCCPIHSSKALCNREKMEVAITQQNLNSQWKQECCSGICMGLRHDYEKKIIKVLNFLQIKKPCIKESRLSWALLIQEKILKRKLRCQGWYQWLKGVSAPMWEAGWKNHEHVQNVNFLAHIEVKIISRSQVLREAKCSIFKF